MLTPLDIQTKEFTSVFRGYKAEEVDAFLDNIIMDYELLYRENLDLKEQLVQSERNIARYREMEDILQKTLTTVQNTADEVRRNAEKEAQLSLDQAKIEATSLIWEAEHKASVIVGEAEKKAAAIISFSDDRAGLVIEEKYRFEKQIQVYRSQFRALIEAQLRLLDEDNLDLFVTAEDLHKENGSPKSTSSVELSEENPPEKSVRLDNAKDARYSVQEDKPNLVKEQAKKAALLDPEDLDDQDTKTIKKAKGSK